MRKAIIVLALSSLLLTTGCWRRWVEPVVRYPVIPVEEYPEYSIPKKIETEAEKEQIVNALFAAEKYGTALKAKVEVYNRFAKNKNMKAKDLFK